MNDLNMTNTILDTFIVKYYFPHFIFLFNCSLQNQEQQIGGFATVHLSNLNKVIVRINTRHALFKQCAKFTILKTHKKIFLKKKQKACFFKKMEKISTLKKKKKIYYFF